MATVLVKNGLHGTREHHNVEFRILQGIRVGTKGPFLLVDGTGVEGFPQRPIRILVRSDADYEVRGEDAHHFVAHVPQGERPLATVEHQPTVPEESDDSIKARLAERFQILHDMTISAARGTVRGMVVSGAPGVGKSFDVERALERDSLLDRVSFNSEADDQDHKRVNPNTGAFQPRFTMIKGHLSPVGLYKMLYEHSDSGQVVVMDDCDNVLYDEASLNLLKAALDTTRKRVLHWSTGDRSDDLPSKFEFNASIIFITNINFDKTVREGRGKFVPHMEAIMDRCFYLDMTIDTLREKLIRIDQVARDMGMLIKNKLEPNEVEEVLAFVHENAARFRGLSLRKVVQLGSLRRMRAGDWQRVAQVTLFRNTR